MYHSYQLYTRNTGLSYCILGMGSLARYVHVPVKYESFWKITSIKSAFLNFVFAGQHIWHLCETSKFCIVHNEPGANSTCSHQEADWEGHERNRTVGFWIRPGGEGQ